MKVFRLWSSAAAIAIAVGLFTAPPPAHADSYQIFNLAGGYRTDPIGITSSGTVVLFQDGSGLCGIDSFGCFDTFVNGVEVDKSATKPDLVYDNGTPCVPNTFPGVGSVIAAVCNNGREVYGTGRIPPGQNQIYTGPNPVADHFGTGILNFVFLNSSGDFYYLEGNLASGDGEYYEAVDLTSDVPEPASLFLLGTGLLAGLGRMRRRLL